MLRIGFPQAFAQGGSRTEAGAERGAERTRAQALLLPAAMHLRGQHDTIAHPERADAFGAVELVRRNRDHVCVCGRSEFARALHGIAEEQSAGSMGGIGKLLNGLDRADFIVDLHDGDEIGALWDRRLRIDQTSCVYRQNGAIGIGKTRGIEHGRVFNGGDGEAPSPFT